MEERGENASYNFSLWGREKRKKRLAVSKKKGGILTTLLEIAMNQPIHTFVVAKDDIKSPDEVLVQKNDVGMVESESDDRALAFFLK